MSMRIAADTDGKPTQHQQPLFQSQVQSTALVNIPTTIIPFSSSAFVRSSQEIIVTEEQVANNERNSKPQLIKTPLITSSPVITPTNSMLSGYLPSKPIKPLVITTAIVTSPVITLSPVITTTTSMLLSYLLPSNLITSSQSITLTSSTSQSTTTEMIKTISELSSKSLLNSTATIIVTANTSNIQRKDNCTDVSMAKCLSFNISVGNCSCDVSPELCENSTLINETTSNNIHQGTNNTKPKTTVRRIQITNMKSLEELCRHINIPMVICNCKNLQKFCNILQFKSAQESTEVKITCSNWRRYIVFSASIFGLFGNMLVIMVTVTTFEACSSCHKLIGVLAVVDAVYCIVQIEISAQVFFGCTWLLGNFMCKVLTSAVNANGWFGLGIIGIIAIERYVGILHPFSRGLSSRSLIIMIITNMVIGISFAIPHALVLQLNQYRICNEQWDSSNGSLIYSWISFLGSFFIPLIVILYLYIRIMIAVKKAKDISMRMSQNSSSLSGKQVCKRRKESRRITILLTFIIMSFIILVSPNRIIWLISDYGLFQSLSVSAKSSIKILSDIPYSLQVVVNPVIYSVVDQKFRRSLFYMIGLRKYIMKKKSGSNHNHPVQQDIRETN